MKEVTSIFSFFIAIGLLSGAMSVIFAGFLSLLGLGTVLSLWLKNEN